MQLTVCNNCHKLYNVKNIVEYKEGGKTAIANCLHEEFPNNPVSSHRNKCNNPLSILKKKESGIIAEPRMIYPKPSIRQQLNIKVALIAGSSDIPATRKLFVHGSALMKCHRCEKCSVYSEEYRKNHYGGVHTYELSNAESHRKHAYEWLQCNSKNSREDHFKEYGIRWSELLRLPYMDPIRFAVVDPMHCLFLGVAKWIIKSIFVSQGKLSMEQLQVAQNRMDHVKLPSDIGHVGSLALTAEREELQYFLSMRHSTSKIYGTEAIPGQLLKPSYLRVVIPSELRMFLCEWLPEGSRTHLLAYVKWYKNAPSSDIRFKHRFIEPELSNTELWKGEYYEEGCDSLIAVHRILCRATKIRNIRV
ncbi:7317_t:CDS:2, partial [Rhizophagus irregularis]